MGAGDFLSSCIHAVNIGNYLKHLMQYAVGLLFPIQKMRWGALQTGRIDIRDHLWENRPSLRIK